MRDAPFAKATAAEDIRFDPASGQLLTGSFMDYAMPRADTLSAVDCENNPVPTKTNPLGVKGAGQHRDAGHPGVHLARDPTGARLGKAFY